MGVDANAALLNAYSNAVQQALGLYVDAETLVQNDAIVRDKILTYSKGFIQEVTIAVFTWIEHNTHNARTSLLRLFQSPYRNRSLPPHCGKGARGRPARRSAMAVRR
jgi:hypothetical protein